MRLTSFCAIAILLSCITTIASAQEQQAIKNLANRLRNGDGSAALELVKHGKAAVPALTAILTSNEKSLVRGHAAHALGRIGPDAKAAVPALAQSLLEVDMGGRDQSVAEAAALALGRIGSASTVVLVKTLGHKNPQVRGLAANALTRIKPLPKSIAPAIVAAFKNSTKSAGLEILFLIDLMGELGAEAKEAVPTLVAYAKKSLQFQENAAPNQFSVQSISIHAMHAIGKMGPAAAKEALPFVLEALKTKNVSGPLQIHAIEVLGELGPAAKSATPIIMELMKSGDGPPRLVLLECLAKIGFSGDDTMKKALYQGMLDDNAKTRIYSARILGQKYPNDLTVVSVLLESMRHRDAEVRLLATQTLAVVRPSDPSVVEFLENARDDADPRVQKAAAETLKKYKK